MPFWRPSHPPLDNLLPHLERGVSPLKRYGPLLLLLACPDLQGEEIIELSPLSIGTIAIVDNQSVGRVSIGRDGSYSESGPIVLLTPGSPGSYRLQGFSPSSMLSFSVISTALTPPGGSGAILEVTAFDYPGVVVTDAAGATNLTLGLELSTTGNGIGYTGGNYTGSITLFADNP
jgi:hypothetical protein